MRGAEITRANTVFQNYRRLWLYVCWNEYCELSPLLLILVLSWDSINSKTRTKKQKWPHKIEPNTTPSDNTFTRCNQPVSKNLRQQQHLANTPPHNKLHVASRLPLPFIWKCLTRITELSKIQNTKFAWPMTCVERMKWTNGRLPTIWLTGDIKTLIMKCPRGERTLHEPPPPLPKPPLNVDASTLSSSLKESTCRVH